MRTVRQRILEQVRAKGRVSTAELSRALRMPAANVRHHLSILLDEGAIEIASRQPPLGRGRPTNLYTVSLQARQNNLEELAAALLDHVLEGLTGEARSKAIRQIAQKLRVREETAGMSMTQRLHQAVKQLNEHHYEARWEAHAEAPHLILAHCPFAAILKEHPEICQIDAFHIEGLLDAPVIHKARLAHDNRGGTYCLFTVGKKPDP